MFFLKNLSIKKLTVIIFSIIYFIYFLITSISLYSYSQYEFNRTKNLIENSNIILSQQIEEKINTISDVSKYPLLIPDIDTLHAILKENKSYEINNYNYLKHFCDMMLIQNTSINGAYIYDLKGNGVSSTRNSSNEKLKTPLSENWFLESLSSTSNTSLFTNISTVNIFDSSLISTENLVALTRQIVDLTTNELTGILLITISTEKFKSLLASDLPFNDQVLSIYDTSNNLMVTTDNNFSMDISLSDILNDNSVTEYIYENTKYILLCTPIPYLDWTIVNSIPAPEVYKLNGLYIFFFITNLIFFLILISILYIFFSKRVFTPIQTLVNNMSSNNLEINLKRELTYDNNDEVGLLIKSYNEMKSRINNLININYKNKIEQKELELRQLQNQINPHFIYNTLESINMMAQINNALDTSIMVQYFGSIIRYSMNRKINTVTLDKELSIIDNYIYLQKIRFDQLFTIENIVPKKLLQCEIIKMIIQPLIENAIYHGLSECSGDGKIIIQGESFEDKLLLTISDNGVGMDDNTLKDLNDYINDKNNNFKGIALRNINKRLKLKYGNYYRLEIFSLKGKGTSMVLTLPFIIK